MRERRRQDGDGPGSALLFVGLLLLATPSILWFVLLSIGGTLTTIVVRPTWMASFFDAFRIDPIPSDIALTSGQDIIDKAVGLIGILFLGPLGLFALGHLVVLLQHARDRGSGRASELPPVCRKMFRTRPVAIARRPCDFDRVGSFFFGYGSV